MYYINGQNQEVVDVLAFRKKRNRKRHRNKKAKTRETDLSPGHGQNLNRDILPLLAQLPGVLPVVRNNHKLL